MLKAIFILFLISFHLLADEELEYLKENAFKMEKEISKEASIQLDEKKEVVEKKLETQEETLSTSMDKDILDLENEYFKE